MRIIDKTPFQNEQGQVEFLPRLQGTLKYGSNWYPELEAQKKVMSQLDLVLEKGFVLIPTSTCRAARWSSVHLVSAHGVSVIYVRTSRLLRGQGPSGTGWTTAARSRRRWTCSTASCG
jgi:hypothetical protein